MSWSSRLTSSSVKARVAMRPRVPCALANHEEERVESSPLSQRVRRVPHRAARRRPDRRCRPGGRAGLRPDARRLGGAGGGRRACATDLGLGHARRIPSSRASSSASASTTATTPRSRSSTLPEVPVIFAKWTTSLIGHGETIVIPREETRPDYEGELAVVIAERGLPRDGRRRARGGRRLHVLPRRLGTARPARDAAAPVHLRQELRHVRAARPVPRRCRRRRPRRAGQSRPSSRVRRCRARTRAT